MAGKQDAALTEYDRRGRSGRTRTHDELYQRASGIAVTMRDAGVQAGDAVFLQLPNGCEIVEQFLGAMLIGALPCCLAPPRALGGLEAYRTRIASLFDAFEGCYLIAHEDTGSRSGKPYREPFEPTEGRTLDDRYEPAPGDLAFLQLTSGTSRTPKAVQITHGSLVANAAGILESAKAPPDMTFVSWLPLYHDMGLVGMLWTSLAHGTGLHLFRPDTFAARPRTWIQTIASIPAPASVASTAPNFAFQHCVQQITPEEVAALDLSRWVVAGCGAERVRPETLAAFLQHFAPAGFTAESLVPCYGMAETTLAVTFERRNRAPRVVDGQVSCGRPVPDTEIVIRKPDGEPVSADGQEGEITVRGPGLFAGYTDRDVESPIRNGWLHTGDLGHLHDGELFVTGRLKDLIILDGQNLDPSEVEAIAGDIVQTRGGRNAAFAVDVDGRERVVLVVEVARREAGDQLSTWVDGIEAGVAATFGFRLFDLAFVPRGGLPATSSGKVRRAEAARLYQAGLFPRLQPS